VGEIVILRSCISLGLVKNIEWRGLGWLLEEVVEHGGGLGGFSGTKVGGIGKGAVVSLQSVGRQITTRKDGIRVSVHLKCSVGWMCGVLHGRRDWRDVVGYVENEEVNGKTNAQSLVDVFTHVVDR